MGQNKTPKLIKEWWVRNSSKEYTKALHRQKMEFGVLAIFTGEEIVRITPNPGYLAR